MHIPNLIQAKEYIKEVDSIEKNFSQKRILNNLFSKYFPYNKSLEDVLIKCTLLNDFYQTNIIDIYTVAEHIIKINNIDIRLKEADLSLIDEIADVRFKNITRRLYSFATKYCHFQQPGFYPIYDKNVDEALWYFAKNGFTPKIFKRDDLRDYQTFKTVVDDFIDFNKLNCLNYSEIDKYLWQFGKDLTKKKE